MLFTFALFVLVLGACAAPAMGQGITAGYTLYVNFFYPLHFLYNIQVTVRDQTGAVLAHGASPDGSMIVIPVRTENPTLALTVTASGYASGPLSYYMASPPYWTVSGYSTIPVEVIGGDYWIVVNLS